MSSRISLMAPRKGPPQQLTVFKSPVVHDEEPDKIDSNLDVEGSRRMGLPTFIRHDDATILELFFDLFFAANYTVFSQTQSVTSNDDFKAYLGYFCMLWMTWLLVSLYDVRFITDSVFERLVRAVHLGVMVGFAVVAPRFDPSDQHIPTMRTMSVILAVSRFVLALEYGTVLWHVRKYKAARLPLYLQIGLNIAASLIYLGATFRFQDGDSHVFTIWYIVSVGEVAVTCLLSNFWETLSLTNTHLMRRLALLTVMILGDGIIIVAQNVSKIVEGPDAWNPLIIGLVTAAAATIYIIFLVYFDWVAKESHLTAWRQQVWVAVHFPFHLALVLFMQGFTQFVIWAKIFNVITSTTVDTLLLADTEAWASVTSIEVSANLSNITYKYFEQFPPTYVSTWDSVAVALDNITMVSDDFWPEVAAFNEVTSVDPVAVEDFRARWTDDFNLMYNSILVLQAGMNRAVFEAFGVDLAAEIFEEEPELSIDIDAGSFETRVGTETIQRYALVFAYSYVAAGVSLLLLIILAGLAYTGAWDRWYIIRNIVFLVLAFGMGLISVLYYSPKRASDFLLSPWVLPTITIVWFVVLILTHVHRPPSLWRRNSSLGVEPGRPSPKRTGYSWLSTKLSFMKVKDAPYVSVDEGFSSPEIPLVRRQAAQGEVFTPPPAGQEYDLGMWQPTPAHPGGYAEPSDGYGAPSYSYFPSETTQPSAGRYDDNAPVIETAYYGAEGYVSNESTEKAYGTPPGQPPRYP